MPGIYDVVTTGTPIRDVLKADWWNMVTRGASKPSPPSKPPNRQNVPFPSLEIFAQNTTGSTIPRLGIASADGMLFPEASLDAPEIKLTDSDSNLIKPIAIALESIANSGIGRLIVAGYAWASVLVMDETHGFATVASAGDSYLTSAHFGPLRIHDISSGTPPDTRECVVEFVDLRFLFGVMDGDLAAGGVDGVVSVWDGKPGGAVSDSTYNITDVHLVHLDGGDQVSAGKEVGISKVMGAWHITQAECESTAPLPSKQTVTVPADPGP